MVILELNRLNNMMQCILFTIFLLRFRYFVRGIEEEGYLYSIDEKKFLSYDRKNSNNDQRIYLVNDEMPNLFLMEEHFGGGDSILYLAATDKKNLVLDDSRSTYELISWEKHGSANQRFSLKMVPYNRIKLEVMGKCISTNHHSDYLKEEICDNFESSRGQYFRWIPKKYHQIVEETIDRKKYSSRDHPRRHEDRGGQPYPDEAYPSRPNHPINSYRDENYFPSRHDEYPRYNSHKPKRQESDQYHPDKNYYEGSNHAPVNSYPEYQKEKYPENDHYRDGNYDNSYQNNRRHKMAPPLPPIVHRDFESDESSFYKNINSSPSLNNDCICFDDELERKLCEYTNIQPLPFVL
ncbi:hypothetical protein CWI38_1188p0010 [Hamiltosporidium tvaerminnensis]|uniref:Uncharacterized protein n=1 Tax=Hamiltosporidium tvaerminnensis TaxID=1176355 RepID=A0A4Q9L2M5_9MICR|nr:hypothetical protein LUQ84_002670 [Hamiltosporidium tvaerminnensis]TBU01275.1 hypothetical protein CWI37_0755p0010 [Hamiltosporidium tvaerminnensis]TBU11473.1 hypothetical protein CWI38_1188p0010 [Hamiltosporidium tvaerminnensis]